MTKLIHDGTYSPKILQDRKRRIKEEDADAEIREFLRETGNS